MAKLVSRAYGEALFALAQEKNLSRGMMEEIRQLRAVLEQNPEFDRLMKHPGISKQEKISAVENVFHGRVSDELAGFLRLVVEKERYGELQAVFDYFTDRVREEERIGVAYVATAVELTESQRESVRKRLLETTSYRTMEMHYSVDASLIGGMVIRINDRVVDSSIKTKLNALTRQLLQIQLG